MKLSIVLMLLSSLHVTAFATPPRDVRGRVVTAEGTPLQGASVVIAGTKKGSTTNTDGRFTINVPGDNVSLVISSVGFVSQTIPVAGQTEINVTLVASTTALDQVVVVGY
ncbi:MAG TPA: carboxypeptidase-like regulatory domain-containing protein, partial [Segetibacter sp.]|nr:carboxypeptidase-like regulatory domain-containing protein [Segetibacter sp.]